MTNLVGCNIRGAEQDLYRTDTVIYIPADPTTEETEPVTGGMVETEDTAETEPSEAETTKETVPETTKAATTGKSSGSSGSSGKNSGSSTKKPEQTEATTAPAVPETTPTEEVTEAPAETESPLYDISGYAPGGLEMAMMDEINNYRIAEGLEPLGKNMRLCAIASARAYEASSTWSSARPDGSYFSSIFQDYGFGCGASAQNLIYTSGGEDAATLVARWMDSEGNRANLMNPGFYNVGIGAYYANGITYIACFVTG